MKDRPEKIDSENCYYFEQLETIRLKYPNNPRVLNHLSTGYEHIGRKDLCEKIIDESYEKFPNYLFSKTAKAQKYLKLSQLEKVDEIFGGARTLKRLYPQRSVFHISEVRAFSHCMVLYFCRLGNITLAKVYLQLMEEVLTEDDVALLQARRFVGILKKFQHLLD